MSYDCNQKAALYAQAAITDYWVIDIKNESVIDFKNPGHKEHQQKVIHNKSSILNPKLFPELYIEVAKLFP